MKPRPYHPFYCEENIWHLASEERNGYVVLISNETRSVACFSQKRAGASATPLIWDYHVVWLSDAGMIWDFDTALPHPVPALRYLEETFPFMPPPYAPMFRVVRGAAFLRSFASDRSHMKDHFGAYLAPPPPWPPIGDGTNLDAYLDMKNGEIGRVVDLPGLVAFVDRLRLRAGRAPGKR